MRRLYAGAVLMVLLFNPAWGAVKDQEVEYRAGDMVFKGTLAFDDAAKGKRPAVLVVHEWWGHDEHARNSARKLAKAGFVALAVDMYGDGKQAHHPQDAGAMSGEVGKNLELMQKRFNAAREFLTKQPNVDATRVAAIGYCFGGTVVLQMARLGSDLRGVVSLHGGLGTEQPAQKGKIKSKILVLTGGADPFVPQEQVNAFEQEMKAAGANYKLIVYPGVKHSFTNPAATETGKKFNIPLEYNAEADKKSWAETEKFLKSTLK